MINLADTNPREGNYTSAAFHVEHFSIAGNGFFRGSGNEIAWALGTGHYGYKNASIECISKNRYRFKATMIQVDPVDFGGEWRAFASLDYQAAHELQFKYNYPTFEQWQEWTVDIEYKIHSDTRGKTAPVYTGEV